MREVGRNADVFRPEAGKLLKAGSRVGFPQRPHARATGEDTTAPPRDRVQVPSEGLQAEGVRGLNRRDRRHRHPADGGGPEDRDVHDADAADEDRRLRAAHARRRRAHVPRRDLGPRIETLSCSGYDHSWVRIVSVRGRLRRRCCRRARSCASPATTTTRPRTGTSSIRATGRASGTGRSTT